MSDLFEHLGSIHIGSNSDAIDPINSAEEKQNV